MSAAKAFFPLALLLIVSALGCGANAGTPPKASTNPGTTTPAAPTGFSMNPTPPAASPTTPVPPSTVQPTPPAQPGPAGLQPVPPIQPLTPTAPGTPTSPTAPGAPTTPTQPGNATLTPTTPTPPVSTSITPSGTQYQASLMYGGLGSGLAADAARGTVSVDGSGNVSIQVSGAAPSSTYHFVFSLYPATRYPQQMDLAADLVTDANGNGQLTFRFPRPGTWAGYFQAYDGAPNGPTTTYLTTYDSSHGTETFTLLPQGAVNPQGVCAPGGCTANQQDPLNTGTIRVINGAATVTLTGAAPNVTYGIVGCGSGGSDCVSLGSVNTDPNGNGAAQVNVSANPVAVFTLTRTAALGFVTGFVAPK